VLQTAAGLLNNAAGLAASLSSYAALAPLQSAPTATISYVPEELQEQQQKIQYPSCRVYCDKVQNGAKVKFRSFSGTYQVVYEITHSQDRLDGLTDTLQATADAVGQVLDNNHGNLGGGVVLQPGYEIETDAVKRGGVHYLQRARVTCQLTWER
jgi:hypothetical protein